MRQAYAKNQFDAAFRSIESALQDITDRLDSLPGSRTRRSTLRRAGRNLRRTAGSIADHVPFDRASEMAADTGRVVRQNPIKTALTAAIAGYCIWSLIRYSTSHPAAGRRSQTSDAETNRRLQEDIGAGIRDEEAHPRH